MPSNLAAGITLAAMAMILAGAHPSAESPDHPARPEPLARAQLVNSRNTRAQPVCLLAEKRSTRVPAPTVMCPERQTLFFLRAVTFGDGLAAGPAG